jgi:hypothetical protein
MTYSPNGKWESLPGYLSSFKHPRGHKRNQYLNRFVRAQLGRDIADDPIRKSQWELESHNRARIKAKLAPSYASCKAFTLRYNKARSQEACHNDWSWVKAQFDIIGGLIINPKPYLNKKTGYWFCMIWGRSYYVHRLIVMDRLDGFIPKGFEVNHIDGDKNNNLSENLELINRVGNMRKYAFGDIAIKRKKETLKKVWDIMVEFQSLPRGDKYRIMMAKGHKRGNLNAYATIFPERKIRDGRRDYWIEKELEKRLNKLMGKVVREGDLNKYF